MSKMILAHPPSILPDEQLLIKKRLNPEESTLITKKKLKRSVDVSTHWKAIQSTHKTNPTKVFPCKSKMDYLIITDPLADRSRFIISKSSYYWLNESIRLMQQHIDYGTTYSAAVIGEIIEIERNLKALKINVEKNGPEKTYFYRAEALVNFIRLCCTIFENPLEKFRRRLHALFNLCASSWLHMLDIMLPISIVRAKKNFVFDEDYGDFENDSILRSFRKDDQQKIQKVNNQVPNLRHVLYSIVFILEKFHENLLIDRIYLERFQMIYEIWMLIDNEINTRENSQFNQKRHEKQSEKLSWDFLGECHKYEQLFGIFTSNTT